MGMGMGMGIVIPTGQMSFYLVYNKKFYKSRKWNHIFSDSYFDTLLASVKEYIEND